MRSQWQSYLGCWIMEQRIYENEGSCLVIDLDVFFFVLIKPKYHSTLELCTYLNELYQWLAHSLGFHGLITVGSWLDRNGFPLAYSDRFHCCAHSCVGACYA